MYIISAGNDELRSILMPCVVLLINSKCLKLFNSFYSKLIHLNYSLILCIHQHQWKVLNNATVFDYNSCICVRRYHTLHESLLYLNLANTCRIRVSSFGVFFYQRLTKKSSNLRHHIRIKPWDIFIHPCSNFKSSLSKSPLNLGRERINEYILYTADNTCAAYI